MVYVAQAGKTFSLISLQEVWASLSPGFDDSFVKVPVSELKFWHTSNQLLLILLSQPRPRTSANLLHHLSIMAELFEGVCSGIEDYWRIFFLLNS